MSRSRAGIRIPGDTPDFELLLCPGWVVFSAEDSYKRPQWTTFRLKNVESVPVVYRIRTKDRAFPRFSQCHGYLAPGAEEEVVIVITQCDSWPRDPVEYAGRRHKCVIENLTVPPNMPAPKDVKAAVSLSRLMFKSTPQLTRMYTKLNFILPKLLEESSSEKSKPA